MHTRNSRWSDAPRIIDGRPEPFRFGPSDIRIFKLVAYGVPAREPWTYRYLPTSYFAPLLGRGSSGIPNRLTKLYRRPQSSLARPPQPMNNCRDLIYMLGRNGAKELRNEGLHIPTLKSGHLPHDLKACMIAASFEYGAASHDLTMELAPKPQNLSPDWTAFKVTGRVVYVEADMGSERLQDTGRDATTITAKYEGYLQHIAMEQLSNVVVLFDTNAPERMDGMIELLKEVIDHHHYPHEYAEQFAFRWMGFDRFVNAIPKLTDWAVSGEWKRAGRIPPFTFAERTAGVP